ncbi:indolepyruvate ferredoxin oxidoreductase family protein [Gilvimarinus sp. F26214L]|uniref:indolepyruvate ferredoxin oxidoreductase family protein n=1 Tax=Gilvimarinus sp. DZF01 TaxID=3461371 RepID=UPI004045AA1B
MAVRKISLDDKYALDTARAYITGIEALVRLPMLQHQRDLEAGLNTAGFISGYRGSPLGTVDQALWKAKPYLDKHHIHFQPGVNEDLAATSVWGSQQVGLFPGAKYDGVFGMWYGKGPGVDRSMDAIKHANAFGTSKHGGVLAVAGDDHACKSSTLPHQSEHMFIGASIPVLNPANVQEVLDLGIFGWELSRFSGCWVGLKAITENMDSAISAEIDPHRVNIVIPEDFEMPPEGLNARWPITPLEQERILNKYRIYAARHFARANNLNKVMIDSPNPRLGIITSGKSYLDVLQALEDLGIDERMAAEIGLRVFKLGMSWPLEPVGTHEFAKGLEEILVVEEKRSIIEDQLTGQLYNWPVSERPRVIGEFDENHQDLLPNLGELTPAQIARAIASRISRFFDSELMHKRLEFLEAKEQRLAQPRKLVERRPHFCSGCPHNTSTKLPDGSVAFAGIGCHYMAQWMDRDTLTTTQMGGEGAIWIGQAPFVETPHVFQNLGDGTYFHSGLLAIRSAIASGVNITYKILYNDAVAMTGGQPVDGTLTVDQIVHQLRGEGIKRIALVSNEPDKYGHDFPRFEGLTIDHRDDLDAIQDELRKTPGTTILIYDQGCASEKRRKLKKLASPPLPKRVFINKAVCEGCGDCSEKSNCLSVLPAATEAGVKREIDQNACNHDYSCLKGFCPSFVTLEGAELRKSKSGAGEIDFPELPEPVKPAIHQPWNIVITGVGGTGVLTVGSLLAMAAHIEGLGCSTLNQTGLAQKFGSVISHVRIAKQQDDIYSVRVPAGDADLLLGCDLVVSASDESLAKLRKGRSYAVVNEYQSVTSDFIFEKDYQFPAEDMKAAIGAEVGDDHLSLTDATRIARQVLGDSIAGNLFLLGYAYQRGLIPLQAESIDAAIELNKVAIEMNRQAFLWGRVAAAQPQFLDQYLGGEQEFTPLTDLDEIIEWRAKFLVDYQDQAYADKYRNFVARVRKTEEVALGTEDKASLKFTKAVAKSYFKLLAYKDEYEVARLYTQTDFRDQLRNRFSGKFKVSFQFAPPLLAKKDPHTGHLRKREFGPWVWPLLSAVARLKFLRGTRFDPLSYTAERRLDRELIASFEQSVEQLLPNINWDNHTTAVEVAKLPQSVRGYGHVKEKAAEGYRQQLAALMDRFANREQVVRIVDRVA